MQGLNPCKTFVTDDLIKSNLIKVKANYFVGLYLLKLIGNDLKKQKQNMHEAKINTTEINLASNKRSVYWKMLMGYHLFLDLNRSIA